MKRCWIFCICIGLLATLCGCAKELKVVVEPMVYQFDGYKREDEQINVVKLSVFFRSNTEVESASLVSISDLQGEGLLDPSYISSGFQKMEEVAENANGALYQLCFSLHMKNGGSAKFTKLQFEVNGQPYEATGDYQINLSHAKEEFMERTYDTGVSVSMNQICIGEYKLPKDAKNIRFSSANSHIKITALENTDENAQCMGWVAQLDSPFKIYSSTIVVSYESQGKTIQKFLPELRGKYENVVYE